MSKIKRYLDVAGNWLLILSIVGFFWFAVWVVLTRERDTPPQPQTQQPAKQSQSWTITDPEGRKWKAVRDE